MPPPKEFIELVALARAYQRSQALAVASRLGVADHLAAGPRSLRDLADACGADPATLYRLLRALASIGVFTELPDGRFEHNATSEFLRSDHPLSVAPVVEMFCGDYEWQAWSALEHSVRTGENAATHVLGMDVWEHRRHDPSASATFDAAMRTFTRSSSDEVDAFDFGRFGVVADIGGGTGAFLTAILQRYPGPRGVLFDQPHVVAGSGPVLADSGVAERVVVVGGSFFDEVPDGADAYVLRRILHDWTDDRCVDILRTVGRAMRADACLVVVDAVVGPPNADPLAKWLDLMMLVSAGGRERTEPEWRELFAASGFRLVRVVPATANSAIIEAVPV